MAPNPYVDSDKLYAADVSTDGGQTWIGDSSGWCSAWVDGEAKRAQDEGRSVIVSGAVVTIQDESGSLERWSPTS